VSFRPNVDRQRIDAFLRELGRVVRRPARLYLVGGTTLVYEGLRRATLDIDFTVELDPAFHGDFMRRLAELKDRLAVNAEEASPGDFIPLPSGWHDRARFIDRFGQVEVFHFDPLSTALSKLARGFEEDFADVRALLRAGFISAEELRNAWDEIAARLPERGWSPSEIADFEANLRHALHELP
jgi:hypothetical protein